MMLKFITIMLAVVFNCAMASTLRTIDGDSIISSDHTKTWPLPSTAGTLANQTSVDGKIPLPSGTPVAGQVLTYNGSSWDSGNPMPIGSGSGVNFFLDDTASDISTYFTLLKYPNTSTSEQTDSVTTSSAKVLIESYTSALAGLGSTTIEAGDWEFNTWAYTSSVSSSPTIYIDVYKRTSGGTETLLFGTSFLVTTTTNNLYTVHSTQSSFSINSTDRLIVKYSGGTAGNSRTISFTHNGNNHYSFFKTPIITRHNDLAGIYGSSEGYHLSAAQYGSIGTLVQEVPSGTINGSNVTFTLAYTPMSNASVQLYQDGLLLIQGSGNDYTISSSTVTMSIAPAYGQKLYVVYLK